MSGYQINGILKNEVNNNCHFTECISEGNFQGNGYFVKANTRVLNSGSKTSTRQNFERLFVIISDYHLFRYILCSRTSAVFRLLKMCVLLCCICVAIFYFSRSLSSIDMPWLTRDSRTVPCIDKDMLSQRLKSVNAAAIVFQPQNSFSTSHLKVPRTAMKKHNLGMDHFEVILAQKSIVTVNSKMECNVGNLVDWLKSHHRQAYHIHCLFDEKLFNPYLDAKTIGGIFHCFIGILEALSKLKMSTKTEVYVHFVSDVTVKRSVFSSFWGRKSTVCNVGSQYEHLHHVFMKAVYLYTNVYKDIYNVNVVYVGY